jgi:translation initiation factor IF-1
VDAYQDYQPGIIRLETDLSAEALEGMTSVGIETRLQAALREVKSERERIFGEPEEEGAEEDEEENRVAGTVVEWLSEENKDEFKFEKVDVITGHFSGKEARQNRRLERNDMIAVRRTFEQPEPSGEFGEHVGYAPQFVLAPDPDAPQQENITLAGMGQMGLIMGDFQYQEIRKSKGSAMIYGPVYDLPLWDDRGRSMEALTIRSGAEWASVAASAAVSVAITTASFGTASPVAAALMGASITAATATADDFVFATADVTGNYAEAGEAYTAAGKKFATSFVTSSIGYGFNGVGGAGGLNQALGINNLTGMEGVLARSGSALAEQATKQVASAAINNIGSGEDYWDNVAQSAFDPDALVGYATSYAGSLVTGSMNQLTSGDMIGIDVGGEQVSAFEKLVGFSKEHQQAVQGIGTLAGSATQAGLEYALTGETTLNIASLSDIAGVLGYNKAPSVGMVEMRLGGEAEHRFSVGSGGISANVGMVADALSGVNVLAQKALVNRYVAQSGNDVAVTMRSAWSQGDRTTRSLYRQILDGETALAGGASGGERAETIMQNGEKTVRLASLGGSVEEQLLASVVLGHEAYRDGVVGPGQTAETEAAARAHTEMALRMAESYGTGLITGDANLNADVMAYAAGEGAFGEYVDQAYDSSADYWKLREDGTIEWDGKRGLYTEDGRLIAAAVDENGDHLGYSESLLHYIGDENAVAHLTATGSTQNEIKGMSRKDLAYALMTSSGAEWSDTQGYFVPANPGAAGGEGQSLTGLLQFQASSSVMEQLQQRTAVDEKFGRYQAFASQGFADTVPGNMLWDDFATAAGEYNNDHMLPSAGVGGEGRISQPFGVEQRTIEIVGPRRLEYAHPGDDVADGLGVYSPGFARVLDGADRDHGLLMDIIGSEYAARLLHLNPTDVSRYSSGEFLTAGTRIADFPQELYGVGSGPHIHMETTWNHPENGWGFTDPSTRTEWYPGGAFSGSYYDPVYDEGAISDWTLNEYDGWTYWTPRPGN